MTTRPEQNFRHRRIRTAGAGVFLSIAKWRPQIWNACVFCADRSQIINHERRLHFCFRAQCAAVHFTPSSRRRLFVLVGSWRAILIFLRVFIACWKFTNLPALTISRCWFSTIVDRSSLKGRNDEVMFGNCTCSRNTWSFRIVKWGSTNKWQITSHFFEFTVLDCSQHGIRYYDIHVIKNIQYLPSPSIV